jgi:hypothetical protein
VLRYMFDDWKPYLYRTDDYGRSWTLLTGANSGFPQDQPTRVIREDPVRAGLLYAGTEFGMFISYDDGTSWQPLQLNLPAVPVTDLKVVGEDLVIATQGRSFWVLDDVSALRQMTSTTMGAAAHLFTPRSAVRMRMPRSDGGPAAPEYPATPVNIDYWLGQEAQTAQLEILNAAGEVLSTVESRTGAQPAERPEQGMRGPPGAQQAAPQLETAPGLHRFGWDLRHAMQGGRGGAIVPPGRYTARLTVGTWTAAQPFEVRMDPRIEADGVTQADLVEQYEFNRTVAALQSEARELLQQVQAARQAAQGQRAQQIDGLLASLTQRREAYPQPMLVEQINYLANMTASADQKIGKDATARLAELRSWLDRDKQKFASLAR